MPLEAHHGHYEEQYHESPQHERDGDAAPPSLTCFPSLVIHRLKLTPEMKRRERGKPNQALDDQAGKEHEKIKN